MAGWRRKRTYRTDYGPRLPFRIDRKKRQKQARAFLKKMNQVKSDHFHFDVKKIALWTFQIVVTVLIAFVFVWYFGVHVTSMDNGMNPQVRNQQTVLVNRVVYNAARPKRGDIIVFKPNGNEKDRYYIRRIIGMPGEKIQIKDGLVYVDGEKLDASYLPNSIAQPGLAEEEIEIASDEYFVLSDNQYNFEDSRATNIGNVKHSDLYGKAWFVPSISRQFGFIR